jgi:hypothetical protein
MSRWLLAVGGGVAAVAALCVAGFGGSPPAVADPGAHDRAASTRSVAEVRQAVARFRDVAVASAAGYVPMGPCASSPAGGMGIHFMNPALMQSGVIDQQHPQALLYAPDGDGGLRLIGAEFWKADADQNLSTDADRPSLAGEPFEGPMLGHAPGMPIHYDLHVWTEVANPSGVFAPWNPRVSC